MPRRNNSGIDQSIPSRASSAGKRCSSSCRTRNHKSWGECVRDKKLHLNPNLMDTNASKRWDRELEDYRSAKRQGVSPDGTTRKKIDEAMRISDETGVAYG